MVKILLVQDTDWVARGPHQHHHLLERLSKQGDEIHVIDFELFWRRKKGEGILTREKTIYPRPKAIQDKIKIFLHRPRMVKIPFLDKLTIPIFHTATILRVIFFHDIDVIIGQTVLNTFCALIISKFLKKPFIFHSIDVIHSISRDYLPKPLVFLSKLLERAIIMMADRIIAVNRGLRDYALKMGARKENVFLIPTGVDFNRYQDNSLRNKLREELGIKPDDLVLFFMGWLYHFSGLKELVERLEEQENRSAIKLLIVGDGDLFPYLKEKSKKNPAIILTGKVPFEQIPAYLSCSDICILPALMNNIMKDIVPIKILEYMAAGKPVVATRLPGLVKEFGNDSGIIYCRGSQDLLEKVKEIMLCNKIKVLGDAARARVKDLDWENLSKVFKDNLVSLLEEGGKMTVPSSKTGSNDET